MIKYIILILSFFINFNSLSQQENSAEYVKKAWSLNGERKFDEVYKITDECIEKFSEEADKLASPLKDFPKDGDPNYSIMNDVAVCYFIKAEALYEDNKKEEAQNILEKLISKYPFAKGYDPRGWYWKVKEIAETTLKKWKEGIIHIEEKLVSDKITKVKIYDEGTEFPVNYQKYGEFQNLGTKDYKYLIKDQIGLAKAVGEGIYPNTNSIKFNLGFIENRNKIQNLNHWDILNTRDLELAFYKWNFAPESDGVRQFFIADILERSGLIKQAIKAYYAILVHFPKSYGWTYWHTPWYIGKTAFYRLKFLIENHPELGLELEDGYIKIINGYDNEIRNDIFIVKPPILKKVSPIKKLKKAKEESLRNKKSKIVEIRGGDRVKLVKYETGDWQLLVNNKPFIIKGITYAPTRVGESPDKGTMQNWMEQDINSNGLIDAPFEVWVDKNRNNIKDDEEETVGDFQLMKEMGINAIRLYHQPFKINKNLIRQLHQKYGIYIILGDFLGKYALGSKAEWNPGTDYDDPVHKENMLNSIKEMVLDFKDEDAVVMWLLGNENVYGVACNADKKPESFFKFANEAAKLIKSLDPQKRPVAIASGDILYLDIFAKNCPDIDVFGTNMYRGKHGFLDFWDEVKSTTSKPAMVTEYGAPSYARGYTEEEAEDYQAEYHKNSWLDIVNNSFGKGAGNSIGGIIFEWTDEWWKAYEPNYHDKKGLFTGPFLDGYMHEEWLGITSQGEGKNSPFLRQLKKAYFTYKELFNKN